MKNNFLWRISVQTSLEAEDAVAEMLGTLLRTSASVYHHLETGISEVSAYVPSKAFLPGKVRREVAMGLDRIRRAGLELGLQKVEVAKVKREDWAESWKKHFKAIEIGDALLVKPSWIKKRPRKNQAVVILDPGLSFGTGQHPTTGFCMHEIVHQSQIGTAKSFLDIGTGSGILAIAAVKMHYKTVRAFDFDPEAVRVARANAQMNGVDKNMSITRWNVTRLPSHPVKKYDLVCANLISTLLISERKTIVAQVNREGTLVLAGILSSEFAMVQAHFESAGLKLVRSRIENEWQSGSFRIR